MCVLTWTISASWLVVNTIYVECKRIHLSFIEIFIGGDTWEVIAVVTLGCPFVAFDLRTQNTPTLSTMVAKKDLLQWKIYCHLHFSTRRRLGLSSDPRLVSFGGEQGIDIRYSRNRRWEDTVQCDIWIKPLVMADTWLWKRNQSEVGLNSSWPKQEVGSWKSERRKRNKGHNNTKKNQELS